MNKTLVLALLAFLTPMAYADQGGFSNSGGSTAVSSGVVINSSVATPSGTLTINGAAQAITGVTHQGFGTGGAAAKGTTAYNSAYTPFYFSNSGQILRSDDLNGTNLITYGTQGSDVGQFYGANGIALDSAGRIYIADTYNGRVVRIDDMNGTNWTSFGTWGSDVGHFMDLSGISIDSTGKIYVMDTGNSRLNMAS